MVGIVKKRLLAALLLIAALTGLTACKSYGNAKKAAGDVQKFYSGISAVSSKYKITSDFNERVNEFTLNYTKKKEENATVTVLEPKEISGISAKISQDTLELSYEGSSLAVAFPEIRGYSPLEALPGILLELKNGVPAEVGSEKISGDECVTLTYEEKVEKQAVTKRIWIDEKTLFPVKAELYTGGSAVLSLEFLTFSAE
ncbi:MAG: hypothetical protein Q8878_09830 [Bacillota bacterium]|nr:hypothetical protein [Bacillota bacterium]